MEPVIAERADRKAPPLILRCGANKRGALQVGKRRAAEEKTMK